MAEPVEGVEGGSVGKLRIGIGGGRVISEGDNLAEPVPSARVMLNRCNGIGREGGLRRVGVVPYAEEGGLYDNSKGSFGSDFSVVIAAPCGRAGGKI